ncbi:cation diffusion facilitator CzcD-associated flavoprotein CzcO [Williamsia sp. R60]
MEGTPIPITGREGRVLADEWSAGAYACKSVAVSGYPNMYFTFGPNSGLNHSSALVCNDRPRTVSFRTLLAARAM